MYPGLLSNLPPGWRNAIAFIIAALALSVIAEKEFPEVVGDELMFGKLEETVRSVLGLESEAPKVPDGTILIDPKVLGVPNAIEQYCRGQFPLDTAAFLECEKKFKH